MLCRRYGYHRDAPTASHCNWSGWFVTRDCEKLWGTPLQKVRVEHSIRGALPLGRWAPMPRCGNDSYALPVGGGMVCQSALAADATARPVRCRPPNAPPRVFPADFPEMLISRGLCCQLACRSLGIDYYRTWRVSWLHGLADASCPSSASDGLQGAVAQASCRSQCPWCRQEGTS
jgi:hypothetical protein